MLTVQPTTDDDILHLAKDIRQADLDELSSCSSTPLLEALHETIALSDQCYTVLNPEQHVCAIYGIHHQTDFMPLRVGVIWMMATTAIIPHRLSFMKQAQRHLEQLRHAFDIVYNVVDERNHLHIKWLQHCGFIFIARHPHWGVEKRPFLEFVKILYPGHDVDYSSV